MKGYAGVAGEYLGSKRRRRTYVCQRNASGSRQTGFDPEISEWGNPFSGNTNDFALSKVGAIERTQGSETSQYLKEK